MKKILFYLVAAFGALTLVSCQGDPGRDGRDGRDGQDGKDYQSYVQVFEVLKKDWIDVSTPEQPGFFEYTFSFPDLDNYIFEYGVVVATRDLDRVVQQPLPYSDYFYTPSTGETYEVIISYQYEIGYITFRLIYSDFYLGQSVADNPDTMLFRVVLLW